MREWDRKWPVLTLRDFQTVPYVNLTTRGPLYILAFHYLQARSQGGLEGHVPLSNLNKSLDCSPPKNKETENGNLYDTNLVAKEMLNYVFSLLFCLFGRSDPSRHVSRNIRPNSAKGICRCVLLDRYCVVFISHINPSLQ